MVKSNRMTVSHAIITAFCSISLAGCYEEYESTPAPQAQTESDKPGTNNTSPHSGYTSTGGSSALGAAKRTSESIVSQAEQHSQNVADQADELNEDN